MFNFFCFLCISLVRANRAQPLYMTINKTHYVLKNKMFAFISNSSLPNRNIPSARANFILVFGTRQSAQNQKNPRYGISPRYYYITIVFNFDFTFFFFFLYFTFDKPGALRKYTRCDMSPKIMKVIVFFFNIYIHDSRG